MCDGSATLSPSHPGTVSTGSHGARRELLVVTGLSRAHVLWPQGSASAVSHYSTGDSGVAAGDGRMNPAQAISNRIVTDNEVDRALHFLANNARELGQAKARMVKAGHMLKHVEALEYKLSSAGSIEARKAEARTSERYLSAITEDAEACGEYEMMRALREAAALKIESWRSEQATYRSMKL